MKLYIYVCVCVCVYLFTWFILLLVLPGSSDAVCEDCHVPIGSVPKRRMCSNITDDQCKDGKPLDFFIPHSCSSSRTCYCDLNEYSLNCVVYQGKLMSFLNRKLHARIDRLFIENSQDTLYVQ